MKYILIYILCVVGVIVFIGLVSLFCFFCKKIHERTGIDVGNIIAWVVITLITALIPFAVILTLMGVIK
jgi:hypothetical protein